jgi:trans-aconitate 2-methyltransferase
MAGMTWNPRQYEIFAAQRSRPFFDLTDRITVENPRRVVDLGCGTGALTATLADRWPDAEVQGIDSSADMLAPASDLTRTRPNLSFRLGDIVEWMPDAHDDVVVTNAALQWVPDHRALLERWLEALPHGAQFGMQVPANSESPSQTLIRALADDPRWAPQLPGVALAVETVLPLGDYLELAVHRGCSVDAWETTYYHLLAGEDPVLEWMTGTRLRPILAALGDQAEEFVETYRQQLRRAFPAGRAGTVFPFLRLFLIAGR